MQSVGLFFERPYTNADHSDVEWGLQGILNNNKRKYMIMISNQTGTVSMNSAFLAEYNNLDDILFSIHSHPGQGATKGASWKTESSPGNGRTGFDMANIINLYKKNEARGKNIPAHYIYHQESKTLYHYTPWQSDIFIKK